MTSAEFTLQGWPRTLEEYEGKLLFALQSFQTVEVVLKSYLNQVAKHPPVGVSAAYRMHDVQNYSLGRLIATFRGINQNVELHRQLEAIVADRNIIAHQSAVARDPHIAKMLGVEVIDLKRMREIDRKAMRAMSALISEFVRTAPKSPDENDPP